VASGACGGHQKPMRFAPRWSSVATPSRWGAAGAGSSTAACEAPTVAVSFIQDSVRMAAGDRQSLRWTEEGVVEHSVQHLVGARTRQRGRSSELGVGAAMDGVAQEKESGTEGGPGLKGEPEGELQPHGVGRGAWRPTEFGRAAAASQQ
jgi:plastocyanin